MNWQKGFADLPGKKNKKLLPIFLTLFAGCSSRSYFDSGHEVCVHDAADGDFLCSNGSTSTPSVKKYQEADGFVCMNPDVAERVFNSCRLR